MDQRVVAHRPRCREERGREGGRAAAAAAAARRCESSCLRNERKELSERRRGKTSFTSATHSPHKQHCGIRLVACVALCFPPFPRRSLGMIPPRCCRDVLSRCRYQQRCQLRDRIYASAVLRTRFRMLIRQDLSATLEWILRGQPRNR
jgi:hypothetical protein